MPQNFLEVALVSALLGFIFGLPFKSTMVARQYAIFSFLIGTLSWMLKMAIFKDLSQPNLARVFSWDLTCFTLIYGSTARKGIKRIIETHWPELMLKIPTLKLL